AGLAAVSLADHHLARDQRGGEGTVPDPGAGHREGARLRPRDADLRTGWPPRRRAGPEPHDGRDIRARPEKLSGARLGPGREALHRRRQDHRRRRPLAPLPAPVRAVPQAPAAAGVGHGACTYPSPRRGRPQAMNEARALPITTPLPAGTAGFVSGFSAFLVGMKLVLPGGGLFRYALAPILLSMFVATGVAVGAFFAAKYWMV